jgi:chromosome segregation ATPase
MILAVDAIKRVTKAHKDVTTKHEQRLNEHEAGLDNHEQRLNNQDARLTDQEEYIHSSVQEMESKVTHLHKEIDVTNSKLTSLGERIDTLRNDQTVLRSEITSQLTVFSTTIQEFMTNTVTMIRGISEDNSRINQESTQVSTIGDVPDPEIRKRLVEIALGNNKNNTNTMLLQAEFESNKEKMRQGYLSDNEIKKTAIFLSEKNHTTVEHEEKRLRTTRESVLFADYVD